MKNFPQTLSPGAGRFEKITQGQWEQVAKLTASDGAANDYFGRQVAISGDVVVVGNNGIGIEKGHVFVKPVGGWGDMTETAVLRSSDYSATQTQRFGAAVAMENDTIVTGAPSADSDVGSGNINVGTIYLFEKTGADEAVFRATDHIVLGKETKVLKGGVLSVVIVP